MIFDSKLTASIQNNDSNRRHPGFCFDSNIGMPGCVFDRRAQYALCYGLERTRVILVPRPPPSSLLAVRC